MTDLTGLVAACLEGQNPRPITKFNPHHDARGRFATADGRSGAADGQGSLPLGDETDQTKTVAFRRWFGDSKVVGADGKPLVVYHGTSNDVSAFKPGRGTVSTTFGAVEVERHGFFFSESPSDVEAYAMQGYRQNLYPEPDLGEYGAEGRSESLRQRQAARTGPNIIPVYLSIQNPVDFENLTSDERDVLEAEGLDRNWLDYHAGGSETWEQLDDEAGAHLVGALRRAGYDGIQMFEINPDTRAQMHTWVAFDPTQIKSATGNRGSFDPTNPDLTKFNPYHDDRGRFATADGVSWDRPAQGIDDPDNPVVRDNGLWGSSHSASRTITSTAAMMSGVDGYEERFGNELSERSALIFLTAIYNSPGSKEPLYHGFNNRKDVKFNAGDVFKVPLLATTGDPDHAAGYGVNYVPATDGYSIPTVIEFPIGTKIAPYSRNSPADTREFGYQMNEAIVSGEFRVVGVRQSEGEEQVYISGRRTTYPIVRVEPVSTFNPQTRAWEDVQ